ncbi:prephenate dehydrogenase/arogenate dehydrogenase family protein, partial [Flavobacterium sp.]
MKVAIIGIGLIGGSLARDIRLIWDQAEIIGIDVDTVHVQKAIELGIVNREGAWEEIPQMDVVIVSVPVDKALTVVLEVLDLVNEKTLVIDVG